MTYALAVLEAVEQDEPGEAVAEAIAELEALRAAQEGR